jgi:hypothetical protein
MLGPVISNQHRMTAIKQQVVLIIYSNPTPLALALCVKTKLSTTSELAVG